LAVNTVAIMESTDLLCSQKPPTAFYLEPSEYVLIVFMYSLLQLYPVIQPIKLWDHYISMWSSHYFKYHPCICLQEPRRTTKYFCQDSQPMDQVLTQCHPKYKAGVLVT